VSESLWYLGGIIFVAIGIAVSIGLHELGHLWPAKKFGVKVPTYAIGFGPTLFKFTRGETTYAVKLIPLGGYITMIGMYPPNKTAGAKNNTESQVNKRGFFADMIFSARNAHSEHVTAADKNRMFYQLPVWKRMIIMFGGPLMNLVLGVFLMVVVISGIGTIRQSTTIDQVMPCVIVQPRSISECTDMDPISPASQAGLAAGDEIISVNGKTIETSADLSANLTAGQAAFLTIRPSGSKAIKTIELTPIAAARGKVDANGNPVLGANGTVQLEQRAVIGILFGSERSQQPIAKALEQSAFGITQVVQMILTLPQQLTDVAISTFTGEPRNPNGAVSVVGIGQISGEISSNNNIDVVDKLSVGLSIVASLNFALFGFNMLPLLPLDGGHIAGGVYESLKRGLFRVLRKPAPGPADTALLMPITWFVFILLMAMSALLIIADLVNPITI
jgi:membrane-associated protease RseP (regulator of RpoE activity)